MSEFSVKFRGVRGSFPVPNKNFMQYGGNTSCVEVNVGGHLIILDAGTGIVGVGDDLMEKYISSSIEPENREPMKATLLLSHSHQDHLLGLTFFKPLHVKSTIFNIFGAETKDSDLAKDLDILIFGKTFPIDLGDIACNLNITNIIDQKSIILKPDGKMIVSKDVQNPEENDVLIEFYKAYVHPQNGVILYKITYKNKSVVYATDKECYLGGDKKFIQFAKNCDLLIHDSQYTTEDYLNPYSSKQGYGHSTFDMAVETANQANAKKLVFFHYDPNYDDAKLNRIKDLYISNKNVQLSYEGLELNI